jgi:hypothetical protein
LSSNKHEVVGELVAEHPVELAVIMDTEFFEERTWEVALQNVYNWQVHGIDLDASEVSCTIIAICSPSELHHFQQAALKLSRQHKLKDCHLNYNFILQPCLEDKSPGQAEPSTSVSLVKFNP